MSVPYYTTRPAYDDLVSQPKPVLTTLVVDRIDHSRLAGDTVNHDRIKKHNVYDNKQQHASPRRRTQVAVWWLFTQNLLGHASLTHCPVQALPQAQD